MSKLRVLVVEDSLTVRRYLCEVLASDPGIEVVGEAGDGARAIELCVGLRPDVITMDMMLPVLTGLGATEHIMAHCPTPILIVSASTNRGELFRTYEALAAGAVDVLEKPTGQDPDDAWRARFLSTVKLVSRIRVITHPRARLGALGRAISEPALKSPPAITTSAWEIIAIGASTGGPGALSRVLSSIPRTVTLPIVLVIHINDPFGQAFADWLDQQSSRRVAFAVDGESVASLAGRVALAPPDKHLAVRGGRLRVFDGEERHSCRPSVDVLFESLAVDMGGSTIASLLTGMGRDGARGLLDIRQNGGYTIAQDEATSVVYGMPREAVLLGAAAAVLPLPEIGPAIGRLVLQSQGRGS